MLEKVLRTTERFIPRSIYRFFQPVYHFLLALFGALIYRFPSRKITVIFITGTKGKTSTAEILNNMLEAGGNKTALLGTLRFKIGDESKRNLRKMTIPGRFFVQKFLRDAVDAGCTHAIVEMTSEGARQFRHRFISADALIFTNLSPEHIESHGSYEAYRDAKLEIARALAQSSKSRRLMVANGDDPEARHFLGIPGLTPISYSLSDVEDFSANESKIAFTFHGTPIVSSLGGKFNAYNILAGATLAEKLNVPAGAIALGADKTRLIPGRLERIQMGQGFPVIVDYAHTPDSLEAIYQTFAGFHVIGVLGNTGGGRDRWKRPVMGEIAEKYCDEIILTNEDPYDEDPMTIILEMSAGIKVKKPTVILDRRMAISRAIASALQKKNSAVLITGKGTDPYIMGPKGMKTPWDDRTVAEEELRKVLETKGA